MGNEVRLTWEGKRAVIWPDPAPTLRNIDASAQASPLSANLLITGDNLSAMAALLPDFAGEFALIYLDPPFFTGREFRFSERSPGKGAAAFPAHSESRDVGLYDASDQSDPSDRSGSNAHEVIQNPISQTQNSSGFSDMWAFPQVP